MTETRIPPVFRAELDRLCDLLGRQFAVTPADLLCGDRSKQLTLARWALWFCLRERYGLSYPELARMLGYDHTTILHGVRRARSLELDNERWRLQCTAARNEWLREVAA